MEVLINAGNTSAQFMFSINRTGAEFPNYISKQCAKFNISPSSPGKLERDVIARTLQFIISGTSPARKHSPVPLAHD